MSTRRNFKIFKQITTKGVDMKTNNATLAERFGRNEATEGQGSNMFIKEDTIYSYGEHYKIAVRLNPDQKFATGLGHVYNPERYSATTNKHQAYVRNNLQDYIAIPDCNIDELNLRDYINTLRLEVEEVTGKQSKLKTQGPRYYQFESKIAEMTERLQEVEKFTTALYGGQSIHFIKSIEEEEKAA